MSKRHNSSVTKSENERHGEPTQQTAQVTVQANMLMSRLESSIGRSSAAEYLRVSVLRRKNLLLCMHSLPLRIAHDSLYAPA